MKDKNALKKQLSPEQYRVCCEKGTEAPFSGEYTNLKEDGIYHCICCDAPLFLSNNKYDSGSGWPSYDRPFTKDAVKEIEDTSLGIKRIEVVCTNCGAHLGHVFPDGPQSTGLRYCINSVAMKFDPKVSEE